MQRTLTLFVGCDENRRMTMNIKTLAIPHADTGLASIGLTALAGLMLLLIAGFAQASVLHNGAHDTRHAIAFPCH